MYVDVVVQLDSAPLPLTGAPVQLAAVALLVFIAVFHTGIDGRGIPRLPRLGFGVVDEKRLPSALSKQLYHRLVPRRAPRGLVPALVQYVVLYQKNGVEEQREEREPDLTPVSSDIRPVSCVA